MATAGERNTQVTLKKPTYAAGGFNPVVTFTTVGTCWAAIEWQSGRRYEEAKKANAEVQGVIRIVYRTDIRADWRLTWGNRTVEILSLSNARERNREMVLWCKEAKN
jgi:SPP1 family predicted phage head-tail adaptor